jgi:pimeloyl-ACP methyl ester carboxylesterase
VNFLVVGSVLRLDAESEHDLHRRALLGPEALQRLAQRGPWPVVAADVYAFGADDHIARLLEQLGVSPARERREELRELAPLIAAWLFRRLARKKPTLLIRGALSDVISSSIADRMQLQAPGMKRVDVPDVGHAPMLTEPAAVDAIDEFLRTVP